ncbi:MAG: peptide-methionine (R)-S-oxide reductase MsrB [Eubacteriaceae bacterium]|nr:peptide-methionine (R)-S-oxide reductase MsrB [Eubacteriaceae bacterium]
MEIIYLAGGCFWGIEKLFGSIEGVVSTCVGYGNGFVPNPTYQQVCDGDSGHAEIVRVEYDSAKISLASILEWYYMAIDPLSVDKQGSDEGRQYRTGIYFDDAKYGEDAKNSLAGLEKNLGVKSAIEFGPLECFYEAEEYHQNYLEKYPTGYCHVPFKLIEMAQETARYKRLPDGLLEPRVLEVVRRGATEAPFNNEHYDNFKQGIYVDVTTGQPLFSSQDKFDSGCGWPCFSKPIEPSSVFYRIDRSMPSERIEIRSLIGDAHLGHVFNDGPDDMGGIRYCVNSAALVFVPSKEMQQAGYGDYARLFELGLAD